MKQQFLKSSAKMTSKQHLKCDKKQLKYNKKLQVHQQERDCICSITCSTMHQKHIVHLKCDFIFKPGNMFYGKAQMQQQQNLHVFHTGTAADAAAAVVSAAATVKQQ